MYMGKVFFSSGEIVINGSHDTCAFDNTHDISEAIFEKKHSFKAFFRRLFKEISSKNKYPLGSTICPSYVLHAVTATFRADTDIHFPDCF